MKIAALYVACLLAWTLNAQPSATAAPASDTNKVFQIDLASVLKLAGAQNIDVALAEARLVEARANQEATFWQFLPWFAPGFAYRAHENAIQNVEGRVLDVHRDSYTLGPTVLVQVELGDAIYKRLAARQLTAAAEQALETQRQDSIVAAASAYFDLARSDAAIAVAQEAVRIATEYSRQLDRAVEAGIAFRGDSLRSRTQLERNRFTLRQAEEHRRLAGARLAQLLRLDSTLILQPKQDELAPLTLIETNTALENLIARGLSTRPELRQAQALVAAAEKSKHGAEYGPMVPAVGAQVFVGGLAGGNQSTYRGLANSEDYQVTLGWRIGPGGLFDRTRQKAAEARLNLARLGGEKWRDEIIRQIVDAFTRAHSEADKLAILVRAVEAAETTLRLARERGDFGVGIVLETIHAEQELTRLRHDLLTAIAEHNKAQYNLWKAAGYCAQKAN